MGKSVISCLFEVVPGARCWTFNKVFMVCGPHLQGRVCAAQSPWHSRPLCCHDRTLWRRITTRFTTQWIAVLCIQWINSVHHLNLEAEEGLTPRQCFSRHRECIRKGSCQIVRWRNLVAKENQWICPLIMRQMVEARGLWDTAKRRCNCTAIRPCRGHRGK